MKDEEWESFIAWNSKASKVSSYLSFGTALLGFIGNSVCTKVMGKVQKRVKGVRLIKYLTIVDILVLFVFLAGENTWNLAFLHYERLADALQCFHFLLLPIYATVYTFETYLTILIAVQRCLALTIPFRFKRVMRKTVINKMLIAILLFSVMFNLPDWIYFRPQFYWNDSYNMTMIRTGDFNEILSKEVNFYWAIILMIVRHCVPICLLVVCNIIFIISRRKMTRIGPSDGRLSSSQLTAIVMAITIMSVILHSLFIAFYIVMGFSDVVSINSSSSSYTYLITLFTLKYLKDLLLCVNSSTNFIFYCTFGREFRRVFKSMFMRRAHTQQNLQTEMRAIAHQNL